MKFRILFVVVLAVSSFVFISQVNAQISAPVAPNFQITGTGANCSLNLSWNDLINEDSYEIERSVDGVNFSLIASPGMNTTSWNNGVSPDISYSYRIRAINRVGASPWAMITSKPLFAGLIICTAMEAVGEIIRKISARNYYNKGQALM